MEEGAVSELCCCCCPELVVVYFYLFLFLFCCCLCCPLLAPRRGQALLLMATLPRCVHLVAHLSPPCLRASSLGQKGLVTAAWGLRPQEVVHLVQRPCLRREPQERPPTFPVPGEAQRLRPHQAPEKKTRLVLVETAAPWPREAARGPKALGRRLHHQSLFHHSAVRCRCWRARAGACL